nr:hypothetical protein Iba_scaffold44351CG0010 [Ipomoea batatas]GMD91967.1 hypothetical protein Iba_chr14eCG4540 [Ipomoea batatas]
MTTVKPISSPSPHIYLNKRSSVSEHLNPLKEQSSVAEYSIKYPPDKIYSNEKYGGEIRRNLEDLKEGSFRWNLQPYGFSVFESLRGNGSVVPVDVIRRLAVRGPRTGAASACFSGGGACHLVLLPPLLHLPSLNHRHPPPPTAIYLFPHLYQRASPFFFAIRLTRRYISASQLRNNLFFTLLRLLFVADLCQAPTSY